MKSLQEHLDAPGNPSICPAAFIVREGRIIVGFRRYSERPVWTCPGGRSCIGETVGEALLREVAEEVGITDLRLADYLGEVPGAKSGDFVPVFVGFTGQEPRLMEPEKFSGWRWCLPEDVPDNFINPPALGLISAWIAAHS